MIFNLKGLVVGPKKAGQEATTLVDPKTKLEVATPEAIKKVSIDYCSELLTNRAPKEDFIDDLEFKNAIHEFRMMEVIENDVEFSNDLFEKSLELLKKKAGEKYKFILKSGQAFKSALFNLSNTFGRRRKSLTAGEKQL